jgi:hypothetical protein
MNPPTPPNDPLLRAFLMGRAAAEVLTEVAEKALTEVLSELGKFDAEQRVNVRNFVEQVNQRAEVAMGQVQSQAGVDQTVGHGAAASGHNGYTNPGYTNPGYTNPSRGSDLQATIDDLRAEIAAVRTELQRYRATLN